MVQAPVEPTGGVTGGGWIGGPWYGSDTGWASTMPWLKRSEYEGFAAPL